MIYPSFDDLPPLRYDLIVADPPWHFDLRSVAGETKSAQAHYRTLAISDIFTSFDLESICQRDVWLFLWATAPLLPEQIVLMQRWGFRYRTSIVWRKLFPSGKPAMGTGYIARTMHELVLIGSIGDPKFVKPLRSCIDGVRREHSRKPDEFYRAVEAFSPSVNRLDLFSRQERPGWDSCGNEVAKFEAEAVA